MYCSAHAGIRSISGMLSTAVSSAPFVSRILSSALARSGFSGRRPCSIEAIVSSCTQTRSASSRCVRPAVTAEPAHQRAHELHRRRVLPLPLSGVHTRPTPHPRPYVTHFAPVRKFSYGFAYCTTVVTVSDARLMDDLIQQPCLREQFYRRERRSVPAAREFVRTAVTDWGLGARMDDVLLCVSELATNALVHGVPPGRGYRLQAVAATGTGTGLPHRGARQRRRAAGGTGAGRGVGAGSAARGRARRQVGGRRARSREDRVVRVRRRRLSVISRVGAIWSAMW